MNSQGIVKEGKGAIFYLTLAGFANLKYASMTSVGMDWSKLQKCFQRQFPKWDQTQEELFQRWRPFDFDEATDTIDYYVLRLKQCGQMLKYNEAQVLELFKNTFPTRYCYVLFGIQNLREAVESAKRVLTKEKLDDKLASQSFTPYMSLKHTQELISPYL